ncbi:hypothetical protein NO932_13595 [Pelagibacterium sp. 26DY04]|uniref:hypothetical protein n=1 Tax=unclassified Pelagibacterium TaxID=2623280 RepID=UPI002815AF6C|nr:MULTISPECIES: hypothetical protein [unclassified Pelagibacterium]WMT85952.1 hypothetical protein NO932_13595 [Pelagibacterium sp. 26DY04]WMT89762.1 hypothetical protein NO934_13295 [Pelagibacterium sp. H642]
MTYLDPDQSRHGPSARQIVLRILAALAVLAFGWFAFTLGNDDGTGRADIVQEPVARTL